LEVDSVNGRIRVTGYDGRNVEMTAYKTIRAQSDSALQQARQDVKLDITDNADTINIFVNQPGHDRSTVASGSRNNWNGRDLGYEVTFDFDIRVPRDASVRLWTINGGAIEVIDVAGDFLLNNINGAIEMRNVSGSGRAHTINGAVTVAFANNPQRDSHFGSLNGIIDVTLQRDLSADIRFKTFNGGVYTDFPLTSVPGIASTIERSGRLNNRNEFAMLRAGRGGPTLEFDGFNGDVRIRQAK
jgi:DUF4097 and DUF4098 domain-containing protein YvlB